MSIARGGGGTFSCTGWQSPSGGKTDEKMNALKKIFHFLHLIDVSDQAS